MTFDTWTDGMFGLMRAASGYAWIYFVTIAFLGGLFVVNLFLCVIFDEFMKSQARGRVGVGVVIFDEFMKSQATHPTPTPNPTPNPNPNPKPNPNPSS